MFYEVSNEVLRHVVGGSTRSERMVTMATMNMQTALANLTASFANRNNAMQQLFQIIGIMQGNPAGAPGAPPPGYQLAGYTPTGQPDFTAQAPQSAQAATPPTTTPTATA